MNATIVKTFPKLEFNVFCGFFNAFSFQPLIKGNYLSNSKFVTCYYLKMAPKVSKHSKFTKDQDIFANCTVDGAQYAFHENCLY